MGDSHRKEYYIVDAKMAENLGGQEALLYAILVQMSKYRQKDDNGFFDVFTKELATRMSYSERGIRRIRDKLVEHRLIDIRVGKNQLSKTLYRIRK